MTFGFLVGEVIRRVMGLSVGQFHLPEVDPWQLRLPDRVLTRLVH